MSGIFSCFTCCQSEKDIEAGSRPPEGWCSFFSAFEGKDWCEIAQTIAKIIVVAAVAIAAFVYCQPVFVGCLFAGVVAAILMDEAIDKVLAVIEKYWLFTLPIIAIGLFLSAPTTLMIGCGLVAAYVGSQAYLSTNMGQQEIAARNAASPVVAV